jgi:hypothetical protein
MIDKRDYMKFKKFCSTKEMVTRFDETAHRMEENLSQQYIRQRVNNQSLQGAQKTKLQKYQ